MFIAVCSKDVPLVCWDTSMAGELTVALGNTSWVSLFLLPWVVQFC